MPRELNGVRLQEGGWDLLLPLAQLKLNLGWLGRGSAVAGVGMGSSRAEGYKVLTYGSRVCTRYINTRTSGRYNSFPRVEE